MDCVLLPLLLGKANFFFKGPEENILGFVGHIQYISL